MVLLTIDVLIVFSSLSGIGTPIVAWMSNLPQPLPAASVGVITQASLVNAAAPIGACTPTKPLTM